MMNSEVIWANGTESIVTLSDFKRYGCQLDEPKWVAEKAKDFLWRFFKQAINVSEDMSEYTAAEILDILFDEEAFSDCEDVKDWAGNNLDRFFKGLWINGELYLDDGSDDISPAPKQYLKDAEALATHHLPANVVPTAMARIAVLCMVLVRLPKDLPAALRTAMLSVWKGNDNPEYPPTEDETFTFSWENLPDNMPATLKILKNTNPFCRQIKLNCSAYGTQTIQIPPYSQLTAVFIGKTMVSIKGSLSANGKHVACQYNGKLQTYHMGLDTWKEQKLEDPDNVWDQVVSSNGRVHTLESSTAIIWENASASRPYQNKIGIFCVENVWVLLGKDGNTQSNIGYMNVKDVVAVTQSAENILILDRAGTVHALDEKTSYTPRSVWDMMMNRFCDVPENGAEQLLFKGRHFIKAADGTLRCL